jgi:DNA-binding protein Fis
MEMQRRAEARSAGWAPDSEIAGTPRGVCSVIAQVLGKLASLAGRRNRICYRASSNSVISLRASMGTRLAAVQRSGPMSDSGWTVRFEELLDTVLPSFVREAAGAENGRLYRSIMTRIELPLLRQALELSGGNQLRAARLLGINRNTLRKRLRLLGLLPRGAPGSRTGQLTAEDVVSR